MWLDPDGSPCSARLFDARTTEDGRINDKTNSIVSLDQPYYKSISIIFRSWTYRRVKRMSGWTTSSSFSTAEMMQSSELNGPPSLTNNEALLFSTAGRSPLLRLPVPPPSLWTSWWCSSWRLSARAWRWGWWTSVASCLSCNLCKIFVKYRNILCIFLQV